MPINLVAVTVVHEIATLILVGGLYFILFVQLPAIASVKSPRVRLRLRRASFRWLFRWGWLGLVLLWLTGAYDLLTNADGGFPAHVRIMAGLSAAFTLLFLIAQFGLFNEATAAMEDGNSERASWLYRRLRFVVGLASVLALVVVLLDVTGPALIPLEGLDLKFLFMRG
jgi:uncharacterized membrane protein